VTQAQHIVEAVIPLQMQNKKLLLSFSTVNTLALLARVLNKALSGINRVNPRFLSTSSLFVKPLPPLESARFNSYNSCKSGFLVSAELLNG
jgi:hypothetical protein